MNDLDLCLEVVCKVMPRIA